ncbi:CLUMA_CG005638, isoform A [Clunio marinus]|uniref:CLUMA_CG005638, isoform A n=1 Tax=Clunio marinus TaxID=568069 RepID=A0A1J1HX09_9DIPT|nr:CLUMA_CG005638, isoform A [Clunio marinus]
MLESLCNAMECCDGNIHVYLRQFVISTVKTSIQSEVWVDKKKHHETMKEFSQTLSSQETEKKKHKLISEFYHTHFQQFTFVMSVNNTELLNVADIYINAKAEYDDDKSAEKNHRRLQLSDPITTFSRQNVKVSSYLRFNLKRLKLHFQLRHSKKQQDKLHSCHKSEKIVTLTCSFMLACLLAPI